MLNNLDLFKVRLIEKLAEAGTLAGAAKSLGITSSAVSQNIRNLERTLGKPLFIRIGKSAKPTELALEIVKHSKPFFSQLASVLDSTHEKITEITIGAPAIFGTTILVQQLGKVQAEFPGVKITVTILNNQRIVQEVTDGRINFGIVDEGPAVKAAREILTEEVYSEELVMCCSKKFWKQNIQNTRVTKNLLKSLPHIPYHSGKEAIYKWYTHHYGRALDLQWSLAIDHAYGVRTAIINHYGLGVLPKSLVDDYSEQIVVIAGPKSALRSRLLLAQNKGRIPSKVEKHIISVLINV